MSKIKFPVIHSGEKSYPSDIKTGKCPICGKAELLSGEGHVHIHGGAILGGESVSGFQPAILTDDLEGFLFIDWEANKSEIENQTSSCVEFEIARDVKKGQFHLLFCSTSCLRKFLNTCVDDLESKINEAKKK